MSLGLHRYNMYFDILQNQFDFSANIIRIWIIRVRTRYKRNIFIIVVFADINTCKYSTCLRTIQIHCAARLAGDRRIKIVSHNDIPRTILNFYTEIIDCQSKCDIGGRFAGVFLPDEHISAITVFIDIYTRNVII